MNAQRRQPAPETPPGDVRLVVRLLLPLAVTALVALLYVNSLSIPFILDAPKAILNHPDVVQADGLWRLWTHDYWAGQSPNPVLYRPLTVLSYHLNAQLWGFAPLGFRIVNMLLLAGLGCLSAMWIARYTRRTVAWLAGLLLVAHPANAEIINHIVGRADLLWLIGVVGFLYTQRRAIEQERWYWWRMLVGLLFVLLAVGAKESGLIVLPAALLQPWVIKRSKNTPPQPVSRSIRLVSAVLILLPAALFVAARALALRAAVAVPSRLTDMTANPLQDASLSERLAGAFSIAWFYVRQTVWPDTSFLHTPAIAPGWGSAATLLGILMLLAGLLALGQALRHRHWLSLPLLMALGQYALVNNLLLPSGTYAANRFTLPFILLAVCATAAWFNRLTQGSTRRRAVAVIPCGMALILMASVVAQGNPHWANDVIRYNVDLQNQPDNPTAMYELGNALINADRATEAIPLLSAVVAMRPDSLQARYKLGRAFLQSGNLEEAAAQYERVIDRYPDDWRAHLTLTDVCLQRRDLGGAEQHLRAAETLVPTEKQVTLYQAQIAAARGQSDDALRLYESLLIRDPNDQLVRQRYEELLNRPHPQTQPETP